MCYNDRFSNGAFYIFSPNSMTGKIFGGLFWAMIADKWKCHRFLSILTCFLSISCLIGGQLGASMVLASQIANRCQMDHNMPNSQSISSSNGTTSNAFATLPESASNMTFTTLGNGESHHEDVIFGSLFFALLILSILKCSQIVVWNF